jgi:hypothetical protein
MDKIIKSRIKSAGVDIINISYLLMIAAIITVFEFFHNRDLALSAPSEIGKYHKIYFFINVVIFILIITKIYSAGKNLSQCDNEKDNHYTDNKYTDSDAAVTKKTSEETDLNDPKVLEALLRKLENK